MVYGQKTRMARVPNANGFNIVNAAKLKTNLRRDQ